MSATDHVLTSNPSRIPVGASSYMSSNPFIIDLSECSPGSDYKPCKWFAHSHRTGCSFWEFFSNGHDRNQAFPSQILPLGPHFRGHLYRIHGFFIHPIRQWRRSIWDSIRALLAKTTGNLISLSEPDDGRVYIKIYRYQKWWRSFYTVIGLIWGSIFQGSRALIYLSALNRPPGGESITGTIIDGDVALL